MASKRLARSCGGCEGVRARARRLLEGTDDASFRGEVLALLLMGERFDFVVGVGEAALGGRCGSDLVVLSLDDDEDEEPGLGKRPVVVDEADFEINAARDDVEALAVGVVDACSLRFLGLILFVWRVCDDGDALLLVVRAAPALRLDRVSDGPASSSDDALDEDATFVAAAPAAAKEERPTAGDDCALLEGVRLRLAYVTVPSLGRDEDGISMVISSSRARSQVLVYCAVCADASIEMGDKER